MRHRWTPLCACLLSALACPSRGQGNAPASAQTLTRRAVPATRTDSPPIVDGDISDAAWAAAPKATVFVDRQNGTIPADQTMAWILYDEKYINVAFHAKDNQPDKITARETIRDYR